MKVIAAFALLLAAAAAAAAQTEVSPLERLRGAPAEARAAAVAALREAGNADAVVCAADAAQCSAACPACCVDALDADSCLLCDEFVCAEDLLGRELRQSESGSDSGSASFESGSGLVSASASASTDDECLPADDDAIQCSTDACYCWNSCDYCCALYESNAGLCQFCSVLFCW